MTKSFQRRERVLDQEKIAMKRLNADHRRHQKRQSPRQLYHNSQRGIVYQMEGLNYQKNCFLAEKSSKEVEVSTNLARD
jgi:hypothetical protein